MIRNSQVTDARKISSFSQITTNVVCAKAIVLALPAATTNLVEHLMKMKRVGTITPKDIQAVTESLQALV